MPSSVFMEWQAFYIADSSDQDTEVTEWDDEASASRKLARIAHWKESVR